MRRLRARGCSLTRPVRRRARVRRGPRAPVRVRAPRRGRAPFPPRGLLPGPGGVPGLGRARLGSQPRGPAAGRPLPGAPGVWEVVSCCVAGSVLKPASALTWWGGRVPSRGARPGLGTRGLGRVLRAPALGRGGGEGPALLPSPAREKVQSRGARLMSNSGCILARLLNLLILTSHLKRQQLRPLRGSPAPTGAEACGLPERFHFYRKQTAALNFKKASPSSGGSVFCLYF